MAQPRVSVQGNKASKSLTKKICGGVALAGETPGLTGQFIGETHRVLECTQTHPPRNQHWKGPICLFVAEEMTEILRKAELAPLFPLGPLPHIQHHNEPSRLSHPGKYPRLRPSTKQVCRDKKKIYAPNEKTDQSSRKRQGTRR